MGQLVYYRNRKVSHTGELPIYFGALTGYKVIMPCSGTRLELYKDNVLIGKADGTFIKFRGRVVPVVNVGFFRWAWKLSESPEKRLYPKGDYYYINDDQVAEVFYGYAASGVGSFFGNAISAFGSNSDEEEFIKITYEKCLSHELAMLLLTSEISRTFHNL